MGDASPRDSTMPDPTDPTSARDDPVATTGFAVVEADAGPAGVSDLPGHVPGYEIIAEIGRGGMGIVYRAHDPAVNRDVAVKVLQDRYRTKPMATRRFVEEGQVTGQLQHPGVPAVHRIGTLPDGSPFLAMKLIRGETLADRLAAPAPDRGRLVAAFLHVAHAVGYAHAKGVIHRDLKPANIMVGQFGEVQVMDWGLAKVLSDAAPRPAPEDTDPASRPSLIETDRSSDPGSYTQAGSVLGTPAYMSPEQAGGEIDKLDERADVFGLGAVLCEILTGDPPYRDTTAEAIRLRAVRGQLADAFARLDGCGADPELVGLCRRCLDPDRDARPRDAGVVAAAVAAHLAAVEDRLRRAERDRAAAEARAAEEANTRRVSEEKAAEQRKRRRWQAAVAGAGVLILGLVGAGAWWADRQAGERRAERERDRAVAAERDRQEAVALLAHAEGVLSAGDLAATDVALAQAEARAGADGPADLRDRLTAVRRDRDLVRELREIDDLSWAPGLASKSRTQADMAGRYRAAFARYGLDMGEADPGAAADAVRASRVSAPLVAGLAEWFCTDPDRPPLRRLLDRLDPDPGRVAIRAAVAAGDRGRVRSLVGALDGAKTPAWFAASVGYLPMVQPADGMRLMTAAWRAHPADYPLAYRITLRLWGRGDDKPGEMLGWARIAVALRPDSPFPHNLLGFAWRLLGNREEAEASYRRAIDLGGRYAKFTSAHFNLGALLMEKGDLDGAEAVHRAGLAIDPDSPGGNYYMGLLCATRGDLAAAEQWYRRAVEADPTWAHARGALDALVRRRALLARLDAVADGRAEPVTAAQAIAYAELAVAPPRRRHVLAVRLYAWAFAANPARADDPKAWHRYNAACSAALAAAGRDTEMVTFGVEEWGHLTDLALKWLRADLAQLTARGKNRQLWPEVRERLTLWKSDPDLAAVRDPEWLAAMPPADRAAWGRLWADVDALLADTRPGPGR